MATKPTRNDVAEKRNMTAPTIYEQRAGDAVRVLISGPNADKLTARAFGCSLRMAQHLRRGRHWTVKRFSQASAVLGCAFDTLLTPASSAEHYAEAADLRGITERLARLEEAYEAVASWNPAGLASGEGQAPVSAGRTAHEGSDGGALPGYDTRAGSAPPAMGIRALRRRQVADGAAEHVGAPGEEGRE